jgi:hypothetical protein
MGGDGRNRMSVPVGVLFLTCGNPGDGGLTVSVTG